MPVWLISRSIRKVGIPASLAFCTAWIDASAPALSTMIAFAPCAIARSKCWSCSAASSWISTSVSYPSALAAAVRQLRFRAKTGFVHEGVMITISSAVSHRDSGLAPGLQSPPGLSDTPIDVVGGNQLARRRFVSSAGATPSLNVSCSPARPPAPEM